MEILNEALKTGITPGIIVGIYLLIVKLLDNKKDNKQVKINTQTVDVMNKIDRFISVFTNDIVTKDKDKCRIAVKDSFYSSAMRIIEFVVRTIASNNIELNRENIIYNIHNIVKSEYYTIYNTLSMYTINSTNINNILKEEWIKETEIALISVIYNKDLNSTQKIVGCITKIDSLFANYVTYLNNNGIK